MPSSKHKYTQNKNVNTFHIQSRHNLSTQFRFKDKFWQTLYTMYTHQCIYTSKHSTHKMLNTSFTKYTHVSVHISYKKNTHQCIYTSKHITHKMFKLHVQSLLMYVYTFLKQSTHKYSHTSYTIYTRKCTHFI